MSPCIVQQIFRQTIGVELDQSIVDEVLFPLLRQRKHGPKELLQDIKLTQSCNEYGRSAIVRRVGRLDRHKNISPFPESCLMRSQQCCLRCWGSIDILNELRNLKYPQFGQRDIDYYFLRLEENRINVKKSVTRIQRQRLRRTNELHRHNILEFVNDYLEYALNARSDPCLVWNPMNHTIRSS